MICAGAGAAPRAPPLRTRGDRHYTTPMVDEQKLPVRLIARDEAIERLQDHYARNDLDVEEFEQLVERAERATNDQELVRLFDGLPSLEPPAPPPGRVTATVRATLGSATRRGRWRVPSLVKVRAVLGSVELDLSDAELSAGETVLEVRALLGSVTLTVPEGLSVESEGDALLGSFDHLAQEPASRRDTRRLRVVGKATLGSVEIVVKKRAGVIDDLKRTVRGLLGG